MSNIPTTQLWIGSSEALVEKVYLYLEEVFGASENSLVSRQIRDRSHYAVRWIAPSKNGYRKVDIEPIFTTLSFALGKKDMFFFVVEHADSFSLTCANSLLKSLEEPPEGYHFILLADRKELVLPTIVSRSLVQRFEQTKGSLAYVRFLDFFQNPGNVPLETVAQELMKVEIPDHESRRLLDTILEYWLEQYTYALQNNNMEQAGYADAFVQRLRYAGQRPAMPGSAKLFWRNLYLLLLEVS